MEDKKLGQPAKIKIEQHIDTTKLSINGVSVDGIVSSYKFEVEHEAGCLPVLHLWMPVFDAELYLEKCGVVVHEEHSGI